MSDSATYSVVLSGNLKSGFELERVIDGFSRLFKIPPEKASRIVGTEFVVKRKLELPMAKSYKEKLSGIGFEVLLKIDGGVEELALEPVRAPNTDDDQTAPPSDIEMLCPKCALKQPKAEECSACGVIISKVMQKSIPSADVEIVSQVVEEAPGEDGVTTDAVAEDKPFIAKWMIAAAVAAVLGALLWYAS